MIASLSPSLPSPLPSRHRRPLLLSSWSGLLLCSSSRPRLWSSPTPAAAAVDLVVVVASSASSLPRCRHRYRRRRHSRRCRAPPSAAAIVLVTIVVGRGSTTRTTAAAIVGIRVIAAQLPLSGSPCRGPGHRSRGRCRPDYGLPRRKFECLPWCLR
ncbi:hypothetical protein EDB85DRAFT_303824 [Lactarius pseudohatsudake]|nr:hypothetical protein EDB85DRAFT_303824 [Lactarius pseudohatsudake]